MALRLERSSAETVYFHCEATTVLSWSVRRVLM